MTRFVFLFSFILLTGCINFKDLSGNYYVHQSPKVKLILKEDSTFEFYNARKNPYLHPFEHPDENFWMTKGNWKFEEGYLFLTNDSMATVDSNPELLFQKDLNYEGIEFVALDYDNDTIPILQVKLPDSSTIARFHGSMPFFKVNFKNFTPPQKKDTLRFSFYGYPPIQVAFNQIKNKLTVYQLDMKYNYQAFNNHQLKVRNGKLKDKRYNVKFLKEKTAGNNK